MSHWLGAATVRLLLEDPSVDEVVGIDTEPPRHDLGEAEFLRLNMRHSLIGRLVRSINIDTVVHARTAFEGSPGPESRQAHEANVIGTLNLMAGCSGADNPVRRIVLRSSGHVYGSRFNLPSYIHEEHRLDERSSHPFVRDLVEAEGTAAEFKIRNPEAGVLVLRFAESLNPEEPDLFAQYLDLPVVPTVFGLDPVIQLIHFEDCAQALAQAALRGAPGTYNIASANPLPLSQLLARAGKVSAPVLPPVGIVAGGRILGGLGLSPLPPHLLELLCWGRTLATTRARRLLDFRGRRDTMAAYQEFLRERRLVPFQGESRYTYDKELEDFIHSRRIGAAPPPGPEPALPGHRPLPS